jgi:hypothetical protein
VDATAAQRAVASSCKVGALPALPCSQQSAGETPSARAPACVDETTREAGTTAAEETKRLLRRPLQSSSCDGLTDVSLLAGTSYSPAQPVRVGTKDIPRVAVSVSRFAQTYGPSLFGSGCRSKSMRVTVACCLRPHRVSHRCRPESAWDVDAVATHQVFSAPPSSLRSCRGQLI